MSVKENSRSNKHRVLLTMGFVDYLARKFNDIYIPADKKADDFIKKQYFGLLRTSAIVLSMEDGQAVISMFHITFYIGILLFHYVAFAAPCFHLIDMSFVVFGQSIHFLLLIQLVVIIIVFIQFRRREIYSLHKAVATNFFDYSEPYEGVTQKLIAEVQRERMLLFPIPVSVGLAAAVILILAPIADQYGSFDFNKIAVLTINDNLPFPFADYSYSTEDALAYYTTFASQMILGFILSTAIGVGGFAYIVLSQNISLQMKILLDSLVNIEQRTTLLMATQFGLTYTLSDQKLYARKEFAYCYSKCLKKSFQHHQIILRHFHEWTSLFSVPVFLAYLTGTIVIALSLLSASSWSELPGTTVSSFVLCGAEVGYMYIFSVFSQRITDLNEDLRFQMYCIKWYYCDEGVKRSLRIFQEVTKRPMTLVAGGIIPANMDTFAKVMNSAYSYYNLVVAFHIG